MTILVIHFVGLPDQTTFAALAKMQIRLFGSTRH